MKIESGTVKIVRISDLMKSHSLDPIRVTLDDIEPGKGRINIECYGKAWSSYWGAMGNNTISDFFCHCYNSYLISNLTGGQLISTKFSGNAVKALCKKTIRHRRKGIADTAIRFGCLSTLEAKLLMSELDRLDFDSEADCFRNGRFFDEVFGDEGVFTAVQASEPNPDYQYLERICNAVREALLQLKNTQQVSTV